MFASGLACEWETAQSCIPLDPLVEQRVGSVAEEEIGVGADPFLSARRRSRGIGTESTETKELAGKIRHSVTDMSRKGQTMSTTMTLIVCFPGRVGEK